MNTNIEEKTPQATEEQLKAKYEGKLYRVGMTIPIDDDHEKEFSYHFKRPSVPSYDRYVTTAAKVGITKASKASSSPLTWRKIQALRSPSGIS